MLPHIQQLNSKPKSKDLSLQLHKDSKCLHPIIILHLEIIESEQNLHKIISLLVKADK